MHRLLDHIANIFIARLIERIGLGEIQVAVMNLQPGDIIVVKSDKAISDAGWERLKTQLGGVFPNNLIIAVEDTLELAIVRARAKVKENGHGAR